MTQPPKGGSESFEALPVGGLTAIGLAFDWRGGIVDQPASEFRGGAVYRLLCPLTVRRFLPPLSRHGTSGLNTTNCAMPDLRTQLTHHNALTLRAKKVFATRCVVFDFRRQSRLGTPANRANYDQRC
jgi:hypothetical protein